MAKARFEGKKYDLNRDRSPKLLEVEIILPQPASGVQQAQTLPTMTDEHIFAVARPGKCVKKSE